MPKYRLSDDGASEVIESGSMADALESAEERWQAGSWDTKCLVDVRVAELDDGGKETGNVEWVSVECGEDEPEPECDSDAGHDWQSPHSVVGGLDSNPGVWSTGGTTIVTRECCAHCGKYRRSTSYGSQRNPGQLDAVEYLDADEASSAWAESMSS
jgi:hypothetical protein